MIDKEKKLIDLLKQYPHPNHEGEDFRDTIVGVSLAEFIRICESNPNATFDEILDLIFTEDRFPPLEIVDDE